MQRSPDPATAATAEQPPQTAAPRAVRIYDAFRTAHLERLAVSTPARSWYFYRRADFDESLVDPERPPERVGRVAAVLRLVREPFDVVELMEPAMVVHWPFLVAAITAIRVRDRLTRRRTVICTYCIGNADPTYDVQPRLRLGAGPARRLTRLVLRFLVRSTDRLAFGTEGALDMYRHNVGADALDGRSRVFEALPSPCSCPAAPEGSTRSGQVLFVGSFVERKGVHQTMAAWERLARRRPDARLRIIGAGRLQPEVERWAAHRDEVEVEIDPPRPRIHEALRESAVLVLLSQPQGTWREQIGLPILEGLSHGCEIVTTTETGLAPWLAAHGHDVVTPDAASEVTADALSSALDRAERRGNGSLTELPDTDQRIAADHWMMGWTPPVARAGS